VKSREEGQLGKKTDTRDGRFKELRCGVRKGEREEEAAVIRSSLTMILLDIQSGRRWRGYGERVQGHDKVSTSERI